jgi:hypothetical protein
VGEILLNLTNVSSVRNYLTLCRVVTACMYIQPNNILTTTCGGEAKRQRHTGRDVSVFESLTLIKQPMKRNF